MGERPDRPDEIRRDPLDRQDPLDASRREPDPLTDPVGRPEEVRPDLGPDPALARDAGTASDAAGVGRAEEVDEVEVRRAEIERTRADMGETVDTIQQRLSPQNLKEQAKAQARETAREAGSGFVETVKQNPVPAAMVGIGLGWLLMKSREQGSQQPRYQDRSYPYDYPPEYEHPPRYDYPPAYEERGTRGPSAGRTMGQAQDRAQGATDQARDRAGQLAGRAQDQAGQMSDQAQERAQRAKGGFQQMLQENPLAAGALAVGLGAAVGFSFPETDKEHQVMGEARDSLVERGKERAQDVKERAQRAAEEGQRAAKEEAQNQGLSSE